jgi:hypothetical protein
MAVSPYLWWGWRAVAALMAVLGLLVLTSYVLRFTRVLSTDVWKQSRSRHAARLLLLYSWPVYLVVGGAASVVFVVVQKVS